MNIYFVTVADDVNQVFAAYCIGATNVDGVLDKVNNDLGFTFAELNELEHTDDSIWINNELAMSIVRLDVSDDFIVSAKLKLDN